MEGVCGERGWFLVSEVVAVWHLPRRRWRVSAAWRSGVSAMDVHRVVALSGSWGRRRQLGASTVVGPGKVNAWISPEVGTSEDGGGGFWSVHMRFVLRIC